MFKKHLNMSYLPYHIDNLINLLNDLDFKFKVITITESRLTTKKDWKSSTKVQGYCIKTHQQNQKKMVFYLIFQKNWTIKIGKIWILTKMKCLNQHLLKFSLKSNKNTTIECI